MSRRPTKTDDEILGQAMRVVRRRGRHVTLSEIGAEVGLTSARLIQRFGSRGRFLALVEDRADRRMIDSIVEDLDLDGEPIGALIERLARVAARNAERLYLLSNSYLYDPGHLAAPDGARAAKAREKLVIARFRDVIDRAVAGRWLVAGLDRGALARAIWVTWVGTYTMWAYAPVGSLRRVVERDLRFLFGPYLTRRARARRSSRMRST